MRNERYSEAKPKEAPVENFTESKVDHPSHYNKKGAMECWDEMELVFGAKVVYFFCICNVWKYRYRAGSKGSPEEDLAKADVYMAKAKEIKDRLEKEKEEASPVIGFSCSDKEGREHKEDS